MTLQIIRATLEHLDSAVPLFDGYRQFYKQASDLAACHAYLHERLENQQSVVFLAFQAEQALGFMQLYPTFSSISLQPAWILNDLFVAPAGRRQGIGAALLEQARAFGADSGARSLALQTAVDNLAAQALYEKLGWRRETDFYSYNLRVRP